MDTIKSVIIADITSNSPVSCKEDVDLGNFTLSSCSIVSNSYTIFGIPGSAMYFESSLYISDASKKLVIIVLADANNVAP